MKKFRQYLYDVTGIDNIVSLYEKPKNQSTKNFMARLKGIQDTFHGYKARMASSPDKVIQTYDSENIVTYKFDEESNTPLQRMKLPISLRRFTKEEDISLEDSTIYIQSSYTSKRGCLAVQQKYDGQSQLND